jgi:RNA polymerase III transcription factor (TF)IIIC subunit HTH domain
LQVKQKHPQARAAVEALLHERPCWLYPHVRERLAANEACTAAAVDAALSALTYRFSAGPWKPALIARGRDPRSDPAFWQYQVLTCILPDTWKGAAMQQELASLASQACSPWRSAQAGAQLPQQPLVPVSVCYTELCQLASLPPTKTMKFQVRTAWQGMCLQPRGQHTRAFENGFLTSMRLLRSPASVSPLCRLFAVRRIEHAPCAHPHVVFHSCICPVECAVQVVDLEGSDVVSGLAAGVPKDSGVEQADDAVDGAIPMDTDAAAEAHADSAGAAPDSTTAPAAGGGSEHVADEPTPEAGAASDAAAQGGACSEEAGWIALEAWQQANAALHDRFIGLLPSAGLGGAKRNSAGVLPSHAKSAAFANGKSCCVTCRVLPQVRVVLRSSLARTLATPKRYTDVMCCAQRVLARASQPLSWPI